LRTAVAAEDRDGLQLMQDRSRIRPCAEELYGLPAAQSFVEGLERRLRAHAARVPRKQPRRLDQRDALLITYADQVVEPGLKPLASLDRFASRHLKDLVNGIHILPFYPASSDDGFSVMDYRAVDPSHGDWGDVKRLAESYQLMFDAVINHASAQGEWFKAFLRDEDPFKDFFLCVEGDRDLSAVVRPRTTPLLTRFATKRGEREVWTTFSADQPDLEYHNPLVLLEMVDVLLFYVEQGASLIRLDAVAYAWKDLGTPCIHRPKVHWIVRLLRAILEEAAPHVLIVTETNVAHDENLSYLGNGGDEAHLVYNFALPPLILHAFQTGQANVLSDWAAGLRLPAGGGSFFNVLATHDGIGLNGARGILTEREIEQMVDRAEPFGAGISRRSNPDGTTSPYEINANFLDALDAAPAVQDAGLQAARFVTAHAIMLSLVGVPGIYFHSLFGSRGWSDGAKRTGRPRTVNREKLMRQDLELELSDAGSPRARILEGMRRVLDMRRTSTAFAPDAGQVILRAGQGVFACTRSGGANDDEVLCVHNVTPASQEVPCSAWEVGGRAVREAEDLSGGGVVEWGALTRLTLAPYESIWLRMRN
jgi:sucrose phosphorylase